MVGPTFAIARETPGCSWPRLEGTGCHKCQGVGLEVATFDLGGNTKRPLFVKGRVLLVQGWYLKLLKGFLTMGSMLPDTGTLSTRSSISAT